MRNDKHAGGAVAPDQPPISINHTTRSSSILLDWDSISQLVKHHLRNEEITHVGDFPLQQEQQRGLLRLYGRGEDSGNGWSDMEADMEQGEATDKHDGYACVDVGVSSPSGSWGGIWGQTPPSAAAFEEPCNPHSWNSPRTKCGCTSRVTRTTSRICTHLLPRRT
jgi:hypothetical protein